MPTLIIIGIALVLFIFFQILMPVKKSAMVKSCGKCLMSFEKGSKVRNILIQVLAFIVIILPLVFTYEYYINAIFCGCGVLGSYIGLKEMHFGPLYGIYENGICYSGTYIPFDKIESYTDVDNNASAITTIRFYLSNKKTVSLAFESESQKRVVLAKLKELKVAR